MFGYEENPEDSPPPVKGVLEGNEKREEGGQLEKQTLRGTDGRFFPWRDVSLSDKLSRSLVIPALFAVV